MRLVRPTILAALLSSIGLLSCEHENKLQAELRQKAENEKKNGEILARTSPVVKAKVAQVAEIRDLLDPVPRATPEATPPSVSPAMVLRPLHYGRNEGGNTDVILASEMSPLKRGSLGACNHWITMQGGDLTPYELEDILEGCTRVRYVLIVRADVYEKPQVKGGGEFVGGEIEGDVVAFELPEQGKPRLLGAFKARAESPREVEVLRGHEKYLPDKLDDELRKELWRAIEAKIGAPPK